jgi:hypothetical protein
LVLELSAPRPTAPRTEIHVSGGDPVGPLEISTTAGSYEIPVAPAAVRDGVVELEIVSTPYTPALEGAGADRRALGVVLSEIAFIPGADGS